MGEKNGEWTNKDFTDFIQSEACTPLPFSAKGKEVAYLLASDETVQREFGAYDNIRDFLLAEEWN